MKEKPKVAISNHVIRDYHPQLTLLALARVSEI
jgi:hypothetical protein